MNTPATRLAVMLAAITTVASGAAAEAHRPFTAMQHRDAILAGCQAIAIDRPALAAAASEASCRLEAVQLGQLRTANLDLHLVNVYAPDAQRVIAEDDGEREIAQPAARIWQGTVAGEPGSEVFLADSAAGTFGWVTSRGERYVFTTGDPQGERRFACSRRGDQ